MELLRKTEITAHGCKIDEYCKNRPKTEKTKIKDFLENCKTI